VTRKIVAGVIDIANRRADRLKLGDLSIVRDWGWAEEYVHAMWLMLQQAEPADYVIATGEPHSLREFVEEAFCYAGLDWTKHVDHDPGLLRPSMSRSASAVRKRRGRNSAGRPAPGCGTS
jgi:GDPmannose 4,6-dehydratase